MLSNYICIACIVKNEPQVNLPALSPLSLRVHLMRRCQCKKWECRVYSNFWKMYCSDVTTPAASHPGGRRERKVDERKCWKKINISMRTFGLSVWGWHADPPAAQEGWAVDGLKRKGRGGGGVWKGRSQIKCILSSESANSGKGGTKWGSCKRNEKDLSAIKKKTDMRN